MSHLTCIIPLAGQGKRFKDKGYTFPKPLIEAHGKPLIEWAVECVPFANNYIFIALKEHCDKYNLENTLRRITKGVKTEVIKIDEVTKGAACTCLLAEPYLDYNDELIIANSDQYCTYSKLNFDMIRERDKPDGMIFTFQATSSKWSFVDINNKFEVINVAEKNPISCNANVGLYYWRRIADFIFSNEFMIEQGIKTNNEYYLAPSYNELIRAKKTILPFEVNTMVPLGTPEDLEAFLRAK